MMLINSAGNGGWFDEPEYVPTNSDTLYWKMNGGSAVSMDGLFQLTDKAIQKVLPTMNSYQPDYSLTWSLGPTGEVVSTNGSDLQHHFVQSYLSKFKPFDTDELWVPLQTIAMRKDYMYDHHQYVGHEEVWQHSIEAYTNTRGDCEDHSMVLCDWLNALGYEARVVAGTHGKDGHAWVVLYMDEKAFILEATKKTGLKGNSHYPLADLLPAYQPSFMFDHEHYYISKDPENVSHDKDDWESHSVLKRHTPL